jgi:hypothetical protein
MNIKDIFTADELALIDSGNYKPGRAVLDAKLDLVAAAEREAMLHLALLHGAPWHFQEAIRARGQA